MCLLYRAEPAKYERAAARWIARLIAERRLRLSEIDLAAAAFREAATRSARRSGARGLLEVGWFAA